MNEGNKKSLETDNDVKISEMILNFKQCADTAAELSNSVGKFTDLYLNIEKNVTELNGIERSLNSNGEIKELLVVTDDMKDIFNYFNNSIPLLSKSLKSSKKELDSHKDEFKVMLDNFSELPNEMDNSIEKIKLMLSDQSINNKSVLDELKGYVDDKNKKIESDYKRKKKTILVEIRQQLDTGLIDSQKETLKQINESVNKIMNEKMKDIVNDFEDMSNNIVKSISCLGSLEEVNSIYNLYIENGRKLPIYVRKLNWSQNFYFKIEKIGEKKKFFIGESFQICAYGSRFKGKGIHDSFDIDADSKEFILYKNFNFIPENTYDIHNNAFGSNYDITPIDDGDIPF